MKELRGPERLGVRGRAIALVVALVGAASLRADARANARLRREES